MIRVRYGRDRPPPPCYRHAQMPDLTARERTMPRSAALALLLLAFLLPLLGACGKRGAPSPPGPASQITYPKVYPTE
jgi:hypothetical protein